MITLYYIQDKNRKYTYPENGLLHVDKNRIEQKMKRLSNGFVSLYDNENYEIREIEVNRKCECNDYMQTTMFLMKVNTNQTLQMIGSDNYIGIHEKVNIPFDVDIETFTNGNYQLMSEEYFNKYYEIKSK